MIGHVGAGDLAWPGSLTAARCGLLISLTRSCQALRAITLGDQVGTLGPQCPLALAAGFVGRVEHGSFGLNISLFLCAGLAASAATWSRPNRSPSASPASALASRISAPTTG